VAPENGLWLVGENKKGIIPEVLSNSTEREIVITPYRYDSVAQGRESIKKLGEHLGGKKKPSGSKHKNSVFGKGKISPDSMRPFKNVATASY